MSVELFWKYKKFEHTLFKYKWKLSFSSFFVKKSKHQKHLIYHFANQVKISFYTFLSKDEKVKTELNIMDAYFIFFKISYLFDFCVVFVSILMKKWLNFSG